MGRFAAGVDGLGAAEALAVAVTEGVTVTVAVAVLVECTVLVRVLVDSGAMGTRVGEPQKVSTLVLQSQLSSDSAGAEETGEEGAMEAGELTGLDSAPPATARRLWKASWRRCMLPSARAEPTMAADAKIEPFMVKRIQLRPRKERVPAERVKRWSVLIIKEGG